MSSTAAFLSMSPRSCLVSNTSPIDGKVRIRSMMITAEQVADYESGSLIQEAFPNLNEDEREFIITGITKEQWDKIMENEDE